MSTSNANPPQRVSRSTTGLGQIVVQPQHNPWAPIILSLDGGGIKGLSELFILRRIMDRIQAKIEEDERNNVENANPFLISRPGDENGTTQMPLLPCYFFDYMVGTSTGGLIAVMLGRLRMSVDECIKAYWCLGTKIFWPRRRLRTYSSKKIEDAINKVVSQNNCNTEPNSGHTVHFRQYDYAEREYITYIHDASRRNDTCKVAVLAQKLNDRSQVLHLFRTYDHRTRIPGDPVELNPKVLKDSKLKIWEACRATTAAPFFFRNMVIKDKKYLDGGAGHNNPSKVAWMEAEYMTISDPNNPQTGNIAAIVSLGCGDKRKRHIFGDRKNPLFLYQVWKYGTSKMTNTEEAHKDTRGLAERNGSRYYRFSVNQAEGTDGDDGLKGVKFHDCKKKRLRPWWKLGNQISVPEECSSHPEWYTRLQTQATPSLDTRKKGEFKPDKYLYPTYDRIFGQTERYCQYLNPDSGENISRKIDECAQVLLDYARARRGQDLDLERWKCFLSHPNPQHDQFIPSTRRQQQTTQTGN